MHVDHQLPPDTQAVLLLCGHFGDKETRLAHPLTLSEYNRVAARLRRERMRPGDLLDGAGLRRAEGALLGEVETARLEALMARGVAMSFAVEDWARQGIWVVCREEASYPGRLRAGLGEASPPLLFGAGDVTLLDREALAIVGSREADERALQFTRYVAERCAGEGLAVVSGGARGVDREAMQAALDAGGAVVGILPEGVARVAVARAYRGPVAGGRLVLVSPYHPDARWTRGNAMGRNRHIYAVAAWTLVVSAATEGGTWSGAVECLKKRWGRLLVRAGDGVAEGNPRLIELGGTAIDEASVRQAQSLRAHLNGLFPTTTGGAGAEPTLFSVLASEAPPETLPPPGVQHGLDPSRDAEEKAAPLPEECGDGDVREEPADDNGDEVAAKDVFSLVWPALRPAFDEERADAELPRLATAFDVQTGQLRAWVKRAVDEGYLEKKTRPVRYRLSRPS